MIKVELRWIDQSGAHERNIIEVSRVPCVGELVFWAGYSLRIRTVEHLARKVSVWERPEYVYVATLFGENINKP